MSDAQPTPPEQRWEQPPQPETSSSRQRLKRLGAVGAAVLLVTGIVGIANHAQSAKTTPEVPPASSQLPSTATPTESISVTPTVVPTPSSQKPKPSITANASTNTYPDVASLQGKVGYIERTEQTGGLWGKAVTSPDTNFIDLSCQNGYPEANLVVVTAQNVVRKAYPTYGYTDAAAEFCSGKDITLKSVSGAYATLLSAALANAGVNRVTSSPS